MLLSTLRRRLCAPSRRLSRKWMLRELSLLGCLLAGAASTARAQCEVVDLTASDTAADDRFGCSVAISGDTMVVGAYLDDDKGLGSGAAYVFVRSGGNWTEQDKLTASDGQAVDLFGFAVAIDGDTIVVGAPADDTGGFDTGSAYVFTRAGTTWTQRKKLNAATPVAGDEFGCAVAISGDTILVGADRHDGAGNDSGAAWVFVGGGGTWSQQGTLAASDGATYDWFGWSVALDQDTAVIGSRHAADLGTDTGAAHVFIRSGSSWSEQAILQREDPSASSSFGFAVAVEGNRALVGASEDDEAGLDAGAAYVFVRSGTSWTQERKLLASDGAAIDLFGSSVGISGGTAVVGARNDDSTGSVYVFDRVGASWYEEARLTASDAAGMDDFGQAVAVSGPSIVVGAPLDDDRGDASGSAHVFDPAACGHIGTSYCTASPNSTGAPAAIWASGSASVADNDVTLHVENAPPDKIGIFLYGPAQVSIPLGDGVRCVGGGLHRLRPPVRTALSGIGSRTIDLTVDPLRSGVVEQVPITAYFQFWYRDVGGTSNLTDGLAIDFQ